MKYEHNLEKVEKEREEVDGGFNIHFCSLH